MMYKLKTITVRRDKRGILVDFLRQNELPKKDKQFGQIYYVTFERKGSIRGNHYHTKKKEWFVVVSGSIKVVLEDVLTKSRKQFVLDAKKNKFKRLMIHENIAHSFKSTSQSALLLDYCNKPYVTDDTDTIFYKLL